MSKRLLWKLPAFLHELALSVTGWRMVQIKNAKTGHVIEYVFSDVYPLPSHPFDDRFPVDRETKS